MLNNNKCVWDALKESTTPVILYGMGNGADKVLDEFEKRDPEEEFNNYYAKLQMAFSLSNLKYIFEYCFI